MVLLMVYPPADGDILAIIFEAGSRQTPSSKRRTMMSSTKTALVLGATGGIGGAATRALIAHGWSVTAMRRGGSASVGDHPAGVRWIEGDAMQAADVLRAAQGAQVILHAVNPPGYRNWGRLVLPMIDNSIAAARAVGARLMLPGTIYNYGPDAFPNLAEDAPQHPTTVKGAIRVELERRLAVAAEGGVPVLILRLGDFFGPGGGNNWFAQGLVKPGQHLKAITYPGRKGLGHAWAYLPDAGETIARLLDRMDELEPFARFHFAGHWDADGTQMVAAIATALGRPDVAVKPLPWFLLRVAGWFQETPREIVKMRYLWQQPIRLDNRRLTEVLGAEPHTPLQQAVRETLDGLGVS
jgi:nucleoside-diphosphate-sugar epimerase